jgi:hypothetical protein
LFEIRRILLLSFLAETLERPGNGYSARLATQAKTAHDFMVTLDVYTLQVI